MTKSMSYVCCVYLAVVGTCTVTHTFCHQAPPSLPLLFYLYLHRTHMLIFISSGLIFILSAFDTFKLYRAKNHNIVIYNRRVAIGLQPIITQSLLLSSSISTQVPQKYIGFGWILCWIILTIVVAMKLCKNKFICAQLWTLVASFILDIVAFSNPIEFDTTGVASIIILIAFAWTRHHTIAATPRMRQSPTRISRPSPGILRARRSPISGLNSGSPLPKRRVRTGCTTSPLQHHRSTSPHRVSAPISDLKSGSILPRSLKSPSLREAAVRITPDTSHMHGAQTTSDPNVGSPLEHRRSVSPHAEPRTADDLSDRLSIHHAIEQKPPADTGHGVVALPRPRLPGVRLVIVPCPVRRCLISPGSSPARFVIRPVQQNTVKQNNNKNTQKK